MVERTAKIYAKHGWIRLPTESRIRRCKTLYILTIDHKANRFTARLRKDAAA